MSFWAFTIGVSFLIALVMWVLLEWVAANPEIQGEEGQGEQEEEKDEEKEEKKEEENKTKKPSSKRKKKSKVKKEVQD